ncbi:domain of unknown function DUF1745 [Methylobacterium sp. 4-46]|uniref:FIST signal transduction protein n=1 Tax=unclassified Methylobacterium TaxID=2615210 RepID=UPI000152E4E7|nr:MULTISPECIES: FIST N-terminal domain-containing protein [Methylobacterium]ACA17998.1 domain of unknown function DUF1745 [Methylobacterium sp. 4-46]WFT83601.1 FIST N-terminal domain-containing protein [Methylobacterium nodulans]
MRAHACGVQTAWTEADGAAQAAEAIAAALDRDEVGHLLVFFSAEYDAAALAEALRTRFPGIGVAGCTASGEICAAGGLERGLVAVAFPREGFRVVSTVLTGIDCLDGEATVAAMRGLRARLGQAAPVPLHRFALSLIDGRTHAEERVISAVAWGLDAIPLVGGSAGDALTFSRTALIHDGQAYRNAAVVAVVETTYPVEIFKIDNFEPTPVKFVVTETDAANRTVRELNAEPAAAEYARAVGLRPGELSPMTFATHPLVVRVGGDYFCRAIRRLNPDGSLGLFCAIDEGVVLTLARQRDLLASTEEALVDLDARLGGLDLVIGFECVLRRLDAEMHQIRHPISELYRKYGVVGFETFGEQYRSTHLNQTFTGIAIGRM